MADLFKHVMLAAYDEAVNAMQRPRFLQSFFGKNPTERSMSDTEKVDIDILRTNRAIAVDVIRGAGHSRENDAGMFTGKEYTVPLYSEEAPVTAAQLNKRVPGVSPYEARDRMYAFGYWVGHNQARLSMKIFREMERMASEALQVGTITLANTDSIDFHKISELAVTPGNKWDTANGDPITDLQTICDRIRTYGFMMADTVIFGQSAFNVFIKNAAVIAYMNGRYIEPGRMAPGSFIEGARPWGSMGIGPYQLTFYVYNDSYTHPSTSVDTPYVTTDTAIVLNRSAHLVKAFGAVELLPEVEDEYRRMGLPPIPQMVPGEIVPFVYPRWPSSLVAGVQSAPILIPAAIDTIGTLVNVDT